MNYARADQSQGKLWWKIVSVLTCKSLVKPGYRGERLIESTSSWFPPKGPSGSLSSVPQLHRVKLMIRGFGGEYSSTYYQTLNR